MKNTPEVTTALAMLAEQLSKDKTAIEKAPDSTKVLLFAVIDISLSNDLGMTPEQCAELSRRYKETILNVWLNKDV